MTMTRIGRPIMVQSDSDYYYDEYQRRTAEYERALAAEQAAWDIYEAFQNDYLTFIRMAEMVGLQPYGLDSPTRPGRQALWDIRQGLVNEWRYSQSVMLNARRLRDSAEDRWTSKF